MLLLAVSAADAQDTFATFRDALWRDARDRGISRATFDDAFAGVTPDPRVVAATKRQPEYGKPFGDYVVAMASPSRIAQGRLKAKEWNDTFVALDKTYGVDRATILSIWGIETSYGGAKDRWDVIRSLATLAHARYRDPYFRDELLASLRILEDGHIARVDLLGAWAGAMGQPQFMPSSFLNYAVDFSGDGKNDIWRNVPDVLASIANYMRKSGWQSGLPWGFEVTLPAGFDTRRSRGTFAEWTTLGVRRAGGGKLPGAGDAILFFPSGVTGPAYLVTANFDVIKRYNNSDVYALAVAHLADRIAGGGPFQAKWPADDRQFTRDERIALQTRLRALGHPVSNLTGHFDFELRDVIRTVQAKFGMTVDGHPTPALLGRLAP